MNNEEKTIKELEEMLQEAMVSSNVETLDKLLSDDLMFTSHLGQPMKKEDDLAAHRSGFVKIEKIELSEMKIKTLGDTAVVCVKSAIRGSFGGEVSEGVFRFIRVWEKISNGKWQLAAAQSTLVN